MVLRFFTFSFTSRKLLKLFMNWNFLFSTPLNFESLSSLCIISSRKQVQSYTLFYGW